MLGPPVRRRASHGISADIIAAVTPLVGTESVSYDAAGADLRAHLTAAQLQTFATRLQTDPHFPLWNPLAVGPMKAFYANGWMGQYLWVEPTQHLVGDGQRSLASAIAFTHNAGREALLEEHLNDLS